MSVDTAVSLRQKELTLLYLKHLDVHIHNLKEGKEEKALHIKDFAQRMHVHPVHLSNTVKQVTGQSTCDLYEERLLAAAKDLLRSSSLSIAQVAFQLTYDPSNFTKFFKAYTGMTPKQFRNELK